MDWISSIDWSLVGVISGATASVVSIAVVLWTWLVLPVKFEFLRRDFDSIANRVEALEQDNDRLGRIELSIEHMSKAVDNLTTQAPRLEKASQRISTLETEAKYQRDKIDAMVQKTEQMIGMVKELMRQHREDRERWEASGDVAEEGHA